jgi:GTP-binding protein
MPFMDFAPMVFVTATESRKVQTVLDVAQHLFNQSRIRMGTGQLNQVVKQILEERGPSSPTGRRARIYYATQTDVAPPTIVLFVNRPEFLTEPYRRFVLNRFRELLPYAEIPIRLIVRGRTPSMRTGPARNHDPRSKTSRKPAPSRGSAPKQTQRTGLARRFKKK